MRKSLLGIIFSILILGSAGLVIAILTTIMRAVYFEFTIIPSLFLILLAFSDRTIITNTRLKSVVLAICMVALLASNILQTLSIGVNEAEQILGQETAISKREDYLNAFKLGVNLIKYVRLSEGGFVQISGGSYASAGHEEQIRKSQLRIRSAQKQLGIDPAYTEQYVSWKLEFGKNIAESHERDRQPLEEMFKKGSPNWAQFYAQAIEDQIPSTQARVRAWFRLGYEAGFLFLSKVRHTALFKNIDLYLSSLEKLRMSVGLPQSMVDSYVKSLEASGTNVEQLERIFATFCNNTKGFIKTRAPVGF